MSLESSLHIIQMVVEGIGLIYIVFKGGKHVGRVEEILDSLIKGQAEIKTTVIKHTETDVTNFQQIARDIADSRVTIARLLGLSRRKLPE